MKLNDFEKRAKNLRRKVLDLQSEFGDAHLGGSFSEIEILVALFDRMSEKDKFILSKGHCAYPLYVLLEEKGYHPEIKPHPDLDTKNGIYATTGSLGHGLPIGVGMALAKKFKKQEGDIYVLMGDGECQEGTTWESALIASKYKLDNLTVIIDHNKFQALERLVLPLESLSKKFKSFGWETLEIEGHDFWEIYNALYAASCRSSTKPCLVVANTIKGKGVSFMENNPSWHARVPTEDELKEAYAELE